MKKVWWYIKYTILLPELCLRYISEKYYLNCSEFNGVIAEVTGVTFCETVYMCTRSIACLTHA